jgi:hypothetical protein
MISKMSANELGSMIPPKYREMLYVGMRNRAGEIIDYKHPPVFIHSQLTLKQYRECVFADHISIEDVPIEYTDPMSFILVRPTAMHAVGWIRDSLVGAGFRIAEEVPLGNYRKLADIIYDLSSDLHFTWQWRVIMRSLHDTGVQNQDIALAFLLRENWADEDEYKVAVMDTRSRLRREIGNTPYLFMYRKEAVIGMDLHHLHAPDFSLIGVEYNVLMHAFHRTSVFSD